MPELGAPAAASARWLLGSRDVTGSEEHHQRLHGLQAAAGAVAEFFLLLQHALSSKGARDEHIGVAPAGHLWPSASAVRVNLTLSVA